MTVSELVEHLQTLNPGDEVGVLRGLIFAPLIGVDCHPVSKEYPGTVDYWRRESDPEQTIVELTFMSNSEVACARERADAVS